MPTGESRLLDRAAHRTGCGPKVPLAGAVLTELVKREGIDFATAVLYERLMRSTQLVPFLEKVQNLPPVEAAPSTVLVAIVPGAFHVEFPHTGADGRLVRDEAEQFGWDTELVPFPSLGSLAGNAQILTDWLLDRQERSIVLVSLSKGGADVKTALSRPEADCAFRHVKAWVNLSGLLNGTPLVNWIFASRFRTAWFRFLFWMRGYDFGVVPELAYGPGTPLGGELSAPPHMRVIHVVGFPLKRHLSNRLARRCFRRVRHLGPNDGAGILLSDVCRLPGLVYPVWGADHYLRPAGTDARLVARRILHYVAHELASSERRSECASSYSHLPARSTATAPGSSGRPCVTPLSR
jgi:hypothetical protein